MLYCSAITSDDLLRPIPSRTSLEEAFTAEICQMITVKVVRQASIELSAPIVSSLKKNSKLRFYVRQCVRRNASATYIRLMNRDGELFTVEYVGKWT